MAFRILDDVGLDESPNLRPQSRRVLAVLLARRGHRVSVEALEEAVWGGEFVSERGAIHTAISRARSQLPDGVISRVDGGYRLDVGAIGCDADVFEELLQTAEQTSDHRAALALVESALAQWRGPPFGALGSEPALVAEAGRLSDRHARAVELRASILLVLDRPEDAIDALALPLADHPFHDGLRGLHARSLAATGRRVEALRALNEYRRSLVETGLSPPPSLVALERELLAADGEPPVVSVAPPSSSRAPDAQMPATGIRRHERATLHRAVHDARNGGSRFIVLAADPGMGKSTLASELRDIARASGMRVVVGHCVDSVSVPLATWGTIGRSARQATSFARGPDHRSALIEAAIDVIAESLTAGPLVVILEDCHWADTGSLDLLAAVHAQYGESSGPVLVVVTTRPGGLDDIHRPELARLVREPDVTLVRLEPLDTVDVAKLAADALGSPPSAQLLDDLERASGASPLLIRLICERLVAGSSLSETSFGLVSDAPGTVGLPADLRSPYALAYRSLSPTAMEAVLTVALLADSVPLDLLGDLVRRPVASLHADLAACESVGLLYRTGEGVAFDHDLARRAVLSELPSGERQARHAALADRLIAASPAVAEATPERSSLIAGQLQQAGLLADREALVVWSTAAGDAAAAGTLWREASHHYRVARSRGAGPSLDHRLGAVQYMALDPEAAVTLTRAADASAASGDLDAEIDATLRLHRQARNRNVDALAADARLDALLDRTSTRLQRLRVLAHLAEFSLNRSDRRGPSFVEESQRLVRPDDSPDLRFQVLFAAGLVLTEQLDLERACTALFAADEISGANRLGEPLIRAAQVRLVAGNAEGAQRLLSGRLESALRARRFYAELAWLFTLRANACAVSGDWPASLEAIAEGRGWASVGGVRAAVAQLDGLEVWLARAECGTVNRRLTGLLALVAQPSELRPTDTVDRWLGRFEARPFLPCFSSLWPLALAAELVADQGPTALRAEILTSVERVTEVGVRSLIGWPEPIASLRGRLRGLSPNASVPHP